MRTSNPIERGVQLKLARPTKNLHQLEHRRNLIASLKRVRRNKGSYGGDGVTWQRFGQKFEKNLEKLSQDLVSGRLRKVWIPKKAKKSEKGGGRRKVLFCMLHKSLPFLAKSWVAKIS